MLGNSMNKRKSAEISSNQIITKQAKMSLASDALGDCVLKYDFMTSLQNIAMATIISNCWMNGNIQKEIMELFHGFIRRRRNIVKEWQHIEDVIVSQVSELHLPVSIIKSLKYTVSAIGTSMFNWIKWHDEHLFTTHRKSKYSAVDLITNIVWSPRGKIDYSETAKKILAENYRILSNDHKYKLACTYCLEDEIAALIPVVVDKYYLNGVHIDVHPMVYYWTSRVTGDDSILDKASYSEKYIPSFHEMSIYEHIMQLLISRDSRVKRTFNEVPIKFMLNILNEEERAKYILLLVEEIGSQDLRYSLLSNQNYERQQSIFKECSGIILGDILKDWLWRDYFLKTVLHVLNSMDPQSYLHTLREINKEKLRVSNEDNNYLYYNYKYFFKRIWHKTPSHLKDFIFENKNGNFLEELIFSLIWERDMDIVELMLNDLNTQQKKNTILRIKAIEHCSRLIRNDHWDLLNIFIENTLSTKEDINLLKQCVVNERGRTIAVHFLNQNMFDKVEQFMTWAFQSEEEMSKFRKSLYYVKCEAIFKAFVSNNKTDFMELDCLFKWCAKGNQEEILHFKAKSLDLSWGLKCISDSIKQDKYQLLDEVLNWRFSDNKQEIVQFKNNMYKADGLSPCITSTICVLITEDESLKTLDKFIDWCFSDGHEVEEFKKWLLYPEPLSGYVFLKILEQNEFEVADKLLEKIISSSREISEFKRELMLSDDINFIFHTYVEDDLLDWLYSLVKWFDPSEEMIRKFKSACPECQACTKIFLNL